MCSWAHHTSTPSFVLWQHNWVVMWASVLFFPLKMIIGRNMWPEAVQVSIRRAWLLLLPFTPPFFNSPHIQNTYTSYSTTVILSPFTKRILQFSYHPSLYALPYSSLQNFICQLLASLAYIGISCNQVGNLDCAESRLSWGNPFGFWRIVKHSLLKTVLHLRHVDPKARIFNTVYMVHRWSCWHTHRGIANVKTPG